MVACQPKVLDLNQKHKFEYAGAAGGFIDRYGYPFMRGRLFFDLEEDKGQYDTDVEIFWSTGACFFVRKNMLEKIGILDENFTMHMEEIDLCWRIHLVKKYGIKVVGHYRLTIHRKPTGISETIFSFWQKT
jgi:GT2 family glycosyltransferase